MLDNRLELDIDDPIGQSRRVFERVASEIEELMGLCDRILVMNQGEIVGEFAERPFSDEAILAAAFRETAA